VGLEVEKIVLTHGHIDHAGGAAELKEKLGGVPIEGPHRATSSCSMASAPKEAPTVCRDAQCHSGSLAERRR
jgi:glyoxylase-like metal-dependent hydrolase (beta-lactamase superfamily II)